MRSSHSGKRSRWNESDEEPDEVDTRSSKRASQLPAVVKEESSPPSPTLVQPPKNPPSIHNYYKRPMSILPCASVDKYTKLNKIDEGAYGIVHRAKCTVTGDIVALKRLKLDSEQNGFPVTALREISTLLQMRNHSHIVHVREIVVGSSLTSVFMVMDFIEHDLKSLLQYLKNNNKAWTLSEQKTLLTHLLSATLFLHANAFIHRDLKTSNLLLSNTGILKVADFGLVRQFNSSVRLTPLVVTLWYRAPELLFGTLEYTYAIDLWSIGCIFAELCTLDPIFPGQGEVDQIDLILRTLGSPPKPLMHLPKSKSLNLMRYGSGSKLHNKIPGLTPHAFDLLSKLLEYDPSLRISAKDALEHPYFRENPPPKDPRVFPTFPSRANGEINRRDSPSAPKARHGEIGSSSIADTGSRSSASYKTLFGDSLDA